MPKKSNFRNEDKRQGGKDTDRQERGGRWKESGGHGRPEQPGNPGMERQPVQENYQQPVQQQGSGGLSYYRKLLQARRERNQGAWQAQGNQAKKGCLPKLFMLALPFAFVLTGLIIGF